MICTIHCLGNLKLTIQTKDNVMDEGVNLVYNFTNNKVEEQFILKDNFIINVSSNLAIEVNGDLSPGSELILANIQDSEKQKFYFHQDGSIRTKNGLCIGIPKSTPTNSPLQLQNPKADAYQVWRINSAFK